MIGAIAVVIPARDESELIGRCLESVLLAARQVGGLTVEIVVVADRCTDDTANVARRFAGVTVLKMDAGNVGLARATGVMLALESSGLLPQNVWIANTDADSVVPSDWLVEQASLARAGAGVVLGTVRPDFADLSDAQAHAWATAKAVSTTTVGRTVDDMPTDARVAVGEVYGANLGVRADVYLAVGGFPHLPEHEDVIFVERCAAFGTRIVTTDSCEVLTSGRQVGRTPGGFARYLRDDLLSNPAH